MAKSSDVEIGGWGERFGHGQTYPVKEQKFVQTGEKTKNFAWSALCSISTCVQLSILCENWGRANMKYYDDEKMRDSCTSCVFPSPFAAPPRFLIADPRPECLRTLGELLECDPVLFVKALFYYYHHNAHTTLGCSVSG